MPAVRKALALLLIAGVVAGCGCGSGGTAPVASRGAAAVKVPRKPPVVILVMDEFPTDALLGPDRRVDPARFPNFADLARISTWFPNSTTVYDSTPKAVPLILDGRKPFLGEAADTRDHRHSIYTALGRRGDLPAALLPPRPLAAAGDHPPPGARAPGALPLMGPLDQAGRQARALGQAPAAPAPAMALPPLG